jgi:hypothetical protein
MGPQRPRTGLGVVWYGDDSPLTLQVLKPFRRALRASTHDRYEKRLGLQKKLLEHTPRRFLLYPNKHVARYLRREQNLESCGTWTNSYVDAPTIKLTEVTN